MKKTKAEVMNEIRNGVDEVKFINYLMNYDFTEAEIREFWSNTDLVNWLKYQGKNMSKDFIDELVPHKVTKAELDEKRIRAEYNEAEQKVLSYDWTKASKNKWNKFKSYVRKDLKWGVSTIRGCNDYKTFVEVFVDDRSFAMLEKIGHFDDEHKNKLFAEGGYAAYMNESTEAKTSAYRQLADWLNNN